MAASGSHACARSHWSLPACAQDAKDAVCQLRWLLTARPGAQGGDLVVVTGADHNYNRPGMAKLLIEHVAYFLQHGEVLPSPHGVQRFPQKEK